MSRGGPPSTPTSTRTGHGSTASSTGSTTCSPAPPLCALCTVDPPARPDLPRHTVDGRFCDGCIDTCLDDHARAHWCPVDDLAAQPPDGRP